MTWFILALMIGFMLGVVTMCLMSANGPDDDHYD